MFIASAMGLFLFVFNHRERDPAADSAALHAKESSSTGHKAVGTLGTWHAAESQAKAQPARAATSLPTPPPIGTLLADTYPLLKQRADAGDWRAACRLSFEVDRCNRRSGFELAAKYADASVARTDPKDAGFARIVAMANNARSDADFANRICAGFVERDADDAWRYALQAALDGAPSIKVRYAATWNAALDQGNPAATADGWVAYRQNAPALLQQAIDAGSPEAFQLASVMHLRPESVRWRLLPRDVVASLSYYFALASVSTPAYRTVLEGTAGGIVTDAHLSESDVARAHAAAAVLERKLAGIPAGSIDFSGSSFKNDRNGNQCELER